MIDKVEALSCTQEKCNLVTNLPTLHQIITGSISMSYRNVPQSKRNRDQNGAKTRKESAIFRYFPILGGECAWGLGRRLTDNWLEQFTIGVSALSRCHPEAERSGAEGSAFWRRSKRSFTSLRACDFFRRCPISAAVSRCGTYSPPRSSTGVPTSRPSVGLTWVWLAPNNRTSHWLRSAAWTRLRGLSQGSASRR
jgi:hypothetical protein